MTTRVAITAFAIIVGLTATAAPDGSHDWTRFGYDAGRSNASPVPTRITAANVGTMRRQQVELGGTVDASAIYLHAVGVNGAPHDVFFVTTSFGKTLAIDADSGTVLWQHLPEHFDRWARSYQVTTVTPVSDPDRMSIYTGTPGGEIEKLAVADGHLQWSTPITKLAEREKIASPLNFAGGRVIATTGGYIGDAPPYQGHVALVDAATGHLVSVWNSLCSDRGGLIEPSSCHESGSAIWGRAGAVIDSATGSIFVATGNGRWDGRTNWGDAVIELDAGATRMLGNYTPTNTDQLDNSDADVGSTAPVLLGDMILQSGKDGMLRVLDWKLMRGTAPHQGLETQTERTPGGTGLFSAPAVWRTGATTWLFVGDRGALGAFTYSGGRLQAKWTAKHPTSSPVIAGGLLYAYDVTGFLRIYQPETGAELAALPLGDGHWNSPIVADGRIALPEGLSLIHI